MVTAIAREENGEFCDIVGPVVKTASLLTWSVKDAGSGAGHPANIRLYASLTRLCTRRLKMPHKGLWVYATSSSSTEALLSANSWLLGAHFFCALEIFLVN